MNVAETLERLRDLQRIDEQLVKVRADLAAMPKRLADERKAVDNAQAALDDRRRYATTERAAFQRLDQELKEADKKVTTLRDRQDVSSQRALDAQTKQVEELRAEAGEIEERALEHITNAEAAEAELPGLEQALVDTRASLPDRERALADEEARVSAQRDELEAERARTIDGVAPALIEDFERLWAHKLLPAIVALDKDGVCEGCFREVTLDQQLRVRNHAELLQCPACERFLYPA